MLETDDDPPMTALLAGLAGGVSAVPLLFTALITYSYAPDLDPVERWSWPVLLARAVGHLVGAARLTRRQGHRLLVGVAVATLVGYPLLVVVSSAGELVPVGEMVGALAVVLAGPLLAALLGSSPGARRWADRPSEVPPR
ncbi:hypothetical protein [Modestobacter sp. KNN46-3]|uniref:hypothetical protein n=1 Tax=Modestobacter sp. KNN46-3 TaxID=2711218 RepID=UPI0013E0B120|nr:hypothetical protein [Modestobacter sp. KNN46-3]